jgi:hypothetical protein
MRHLIWLLILVLQVPLELWSNAPESERDKLRTLATLEHCEKDAKKGASKWRIYEVIKDGFWELHVEEVKTII